MKSPNDSEATGRRKRAKSPELQDALRAMRRMGRMVRAENRRWGLPLIVEVDGKIRNIPA